MSADFAVMRLVDQLVKAGDEARVLQQRMNAVRKKRTEIIHNLRKRGITDRWIAEHTGMHPSNVSRLANTTVEED